MSPITTATVIWRNEADELPVGVVGVTTGSNPTDWRATVVGVVTSARAVTARRVYLVSQSAEAEFCLTE